MHSLTLSGADALLARLRQSFFLLLAVMVLWAIAPDALAHGVLKVTRALSRKVLAYC
jgi:hypothetical protein